MLAGIHKGDDSAFTDICRKQSWKRTSQRRAVFNYLCENRTHPSVETVWRGVRENLPDVSLDSVYRILDDFAEAGLVRKLEGTKIIRYDADTSAHEHYVCSECGSMRDFSCLDAEAVAAKCRDFGRVDSIHLTVYGVCGQCVGAKN